MTQLPMPRPVPVFTGRLVSLRPPEPAADAAQYYELNLDPELHRWTGNGVLASVAEAQAELERFVALAEVSTWLIVDRESGRVVGRFFLTLAEQDGERVVGEGNRIARACWRKGHNREARALLFPYIFDELRADRIETGAWSENVNSRRSIEAHGFRWVREESRWNDKYDRMMAMQHYVLTREDWRQLAGIRD